MSESITVSDAKCQLSPLNWYVNGSTYAQSNSLGAKIDVAFTGTELTLGVDVSIHSSYAANDFPRLSISIDGGALSRYTLLSSDVDVVIATGLSSGPHTATIWFTEIIYGTGGPDMTATGTNRRSLRITGLTTDGTFSVPSSFSRILAAYGDSVTEGANALGTSQGSCQSSVTYATLLAQALQCEPAIMSGGGSGWADVPSTWDLKYTGISRLSGGLFVPMPTIVTFNYGINGGASASTVAAMIAAIRGATTPTTPICCIVPWSGSAASDIEDGVVLADDPYAFFINTGRTDYDSPSTNHISVAGHTDFFDDILPLMPDAALPPAPTVTQFGSVFGGLVRCD